MKRLFAVLIVALGIASIPAAATEPSLLDGRWTNPKRTVVIDMSPCGTAWCGRVVSASEKARADARNGGTPDLVGKNLLSGFKPNGKGGWTGRVFLPKQNMSATGTIRAEGRNTLLVKGCALMGLVCKEQRWTRVG